VTSGDRGLHRFEIHKRFKHRLGRLDSVEHVTSEPSSVRPVRVTARLDTGAFLDQPSEPTIATLEAEWRPRSERDAFRVQYTEDDAAWFCGWHQDSTHPNLGSCHFQVDHEAWGEPHREPAAFPDPNPMAVLETCLDRLRKRVPGLPGGVSE
jgi:hypothetical protein